MTEDERESIINEAVQRTLLAIPEVIGNLITNHMSILKINKEFYEQHKEFASDKNSVQEVVEMVEGMNPSLEYKEILERSIPLIKERIRNMKTLDVKSAPRPSRNLSSLEFNGNGEL